MPKDRLATMFARQINFQQFLGKPVSDKPQGEEVAKTAAAIIAEMGEVLHAYQGWKDWRKQIPQVNREDLLEEVVDLWHFIINFTLYLGFSDKEVFDAFLKKNCKNWERQRAAY